MACIRYVLLRGAAILVLLPAGGIDATSAANPVDQLPLVIAQTPSLPEAQESKSEPQPEQDPVAAAEEAVDDARAALRNAMATGGDVRAARRDLQAAIRHLNKVKTAENAEAEENEHGAQKTAEVPVLDAPSEKIPPTASTPLPQLSEDAGRTVAPDDASTATAPPTSDAPPEAGPPTEAGPGRDVAEPTAPTSPTQPPSAAIPSLPASGESSSADDEATPANASAPQQEPSDAATTEPPAPARTETQESAESPSFFRRLFGNDDRRPQDLDKQNSAATDRENTEADKETAEVSDGADPSEDTGEPSLPIFRKLPPLQGPKVVNVTPDSAEVIEETDEKRVIVKKRGRMTIIHDDNDRFRRKGEDVKVEKAKGGTTITTVTRGNGNQVITVRGPAGDILQRYRKKANGEIAMLIGDRDREGRPRRTVNNPLPTVDRSRRYDFARTLPALVVPIPRNQYIVGSQGTSRSQMQQALAAPPIEAIERPYTLDEVQRSARLRAKLRRIDIDTVNFDFGAATITEDQVPNLQAIGNAIAAILAEDPSQVFLIEGHTDAVGSDRSNLALSDRRAETIAQVLTFYFDIPPENLITQGYGEQYLKILTAGPERRNRRGTVRNITTLLVGQR